jgi:hypothetical protein
MRLISNVIDTAWLDLLEKSYKLQSKICVIQSKAMRSGNIFEVRCIFVKIGPETQK